MALSIVMIGCKGTTKNTNDSSSVVEESNDVTTTPEETELTYSITTTYEDWSLALEQLGNVQQKIDDGNIQEAIIVFESLMLDECSNEEVLSKLDDINDQLSIALVNDIENSISNEDYEDAYQAIEQGKNIISDADVEKYKSDIDLKIVSLAEDYIWGHLYIGNYYNVVEYFENMIEIYPSCQPLVEVYENLDDYYVDYVMTDAEYYAGIECYEEALVLVEDALAEIGWENERLVDAYNEYTELYDEYSYTYEENEGDWDSGFANEISDLSVIHMIPGLYFGMSVDEMKNVLDDRQKLNSYSIRGYTYYEYAPYDYYCGELHIPGHIELYFNSNNVLCGYDITIGYTTIDEIYDGYYYTAEQLKGPFDYIYNELVNYYGPCYDGYNPNYDGILELDEYIESYQWQEGESSMHWNRPEYCLDVSYGENILDISNNNYVEVTHICNSLNY